MNIAVLLAGGTGARLGAEIPKQFLKVHGKTIIEHTLNVFEFHAQIDEIAIVIHPQYVEDMSQIVQMGGYQKVKKILLGGAERHHSSWVAINACKEHPEANLIIHDAVRPLIDAETISKVIGALAHYNAVTVAIPATDTMYQVENNLIQHIPKRDHLMRAQTPQAFKQHILQTAYQKFFENENFRATDDCGIVAKYMPKEPVFVVLGSENNLKITHIQDIVIFENLFQNETNIKM